MFSLIVAGETVFALPFLVTRYFRPTFLEVFGFTNTDLGKAMAAYGVVAMLAYFPGGPLADRFSARSLLAGSLVMTSVGGLYMATIPGVQGMATLWGFWGVTSILLLWAALIRATRDWGGKDKQGTAFGILDSGRGFMAAVMAAAAAQAFAMFMPDDPELATAAERTDALRSIIYMYSAATLGAAVLVWFGVPGTRPHPPEEGQRGALWRHIGGVVRLPAIWLQSLIVIAAYVSYKASDDFGLFALDAYGLDEVESAWISNVSAWMRPVAALFAGWLADRWLSSRAVASGFVVLMVGFGSMAVLPPGPGLVWMLVSQIIFACIAVYGLRGIYFALFEQADVSTAATGTAVGIVSVIGYTPDIFMGLVLGVLLDGNPGVLGHQLFFWFVVGAAVVGLVATLAFDRLTRRAPASHE